MFSEKLKELRKQHYLTQADLAKELNLGTSTIGMYENNIRKPSYEVLKKIANYFNVTVDFLIDDDDNLYLVDDALIQTVKKLSPEQLKQARDFINFLIHNPDK